MYVNLPLQILQLQMNDYRYHYMFTSFVSIIDSTVTNIVIGIVNSNQKKKNITKISSVQDIETFDLEDFKYNSVNMTAFRLVDLDEPTVADTLKHMERFQPIGHTILNRSGIIQVRSSVICFLIFLSLCF